AKGAWFDRNVESVVDFALYDGEGAGLVGGPGEPLTATGGSSHRKRRGETEKTSVTLHGCVPPGSCRSQLRPSTPDDARAAASDNQKRSPAVKAAAYSSSNVQPSPSIQAQPSGARPYARNAPTVNSNP